jgi:YVTN family beta-propeller protein/probable HAF family extracellular repeat protein
MRLLTVVGIAILLWGSAAASAQSVVVNSGSSVRFLDGSTSTSDFPAAFTAAQFTAAQTGSAAAVLTSAPFYIASLPHGPGAVWIGTNSAAGAGIGDTALYAASFTLPSNVSSASLTLYYAVDNILGASNPGIYINGTALPNSTGLLCSLCTTSFTQENTYTDANIGPLLVSGTNWIYFDAVNQGGPAGLIFSAVINYTLTQTLPNLTVTPTSLTFNFQMGGTAPGAQTVSVGSTGVALNYTATTSTTTGGTWLSATPGSSTTPGTESVSVNPMGLAAGTYNGSVTITSSGASNSPLTIPVALNVVPTSAGIASRFITIDYPGQGNSTSVLGNNNLGVIVGQYVDASRVVHAFILNNGVFTNIDAAGLGANQTQAWGINDNGDVVGFYVDSTNRAHGFLRQGSGTYSVIDPPGATTTIATGINNLGQIVGFYIDSTGHQNGFLLTNGVFSVITYPQAVGSDVTRINNSGTLIGNYTDASATQHGFLIQNGIPSTIDPPTSTLTEPWGINDGGQVVGGYVPPTSHIVGFELSGGTYQTITFPAAVNALVVYDINDQGQQVGTYVDASGVAHGFVSARGPFLYASNPAGNNLLVIDSSVNLQLAAIPATPGFLASSPDQTQLYMTAGNQVDVVDTASNTIVQAIPVGNNAVGVAYSPLATSAYVANNADNTISVIDTTKRSVITTIPGVPSPVFAAITPDGQSLYVTDAGANGSVTVISTATNSVTSVINGLSHPFVPAITPDGAFVYVTTGTASSGSVTVISTATNSIVDTIPVGNGPINVAFSPDGTTAYVDNQTDSTLSIINTATKTVVSTIPAGPTGTPGWVVVSPDGSSLYVLDLNAIDQISTTSHNVIGSIPATNIWEGAAIFLSSPPTTQTQTQPLSPTAPNQFNFGTHNFTAQYPPGTSFTNVNMTVAAAQTTQVGFQQSLAGQFPGASCIVYSGSGGNCVNYQVSCTDTNGNPITCPSLSTASIDVKTSYDTQQPIFNPGFLRLPTGSNQWQNIFTEFLAQRVDPTTKGKTKGFSDFVAVDLGASNTQGAGTLQIGAPLRPTDPRVFKRGSEINVRFQLKSIANPGEYISDAQAGLSIVMIADAQGHAVSRERLTLPPPAFLYSSGRQSYYRELEFENYAPGTYALTIYGNAFAVQQILFTLK